jgi:hypothetical protein
MPNQTNKQAYKKIMSLDSDKEKKKEIEWVRREREAIDIKRRELVDAQKELNLSYTEVFSIN